jgi:alcohol dehydrogenase class IV
MRFEFATASRILFGPGLVKEVGEIARDLGRRPLLVTGRNRERAEPAASSLRARGMEPVAFAITGEPTTHRVREGLAVAQREGCNFVVAVGGGSVLDAGKAIGALLTNDGGLLDYLEVIGKGRALTRPSAPVVAIPTTAGTGCEVTRNAVLLSPEHQFKVSLRSAYLLPRVAIVDPELTLTLPREVTASTGLDALTQLIEPYVSGRANPVTDALCVEGIRRAARALRHACQEPGDLAAREDMAVAGLFSGLALANAGLGAVHGFAAPIGGMFPAPHGTVCAALLPRVMEVNIRALGARSPGSPARGRYDQVAELLTGRPGAGAEDGVRWVAQTCQELGIPPLRRFGLAREDVPVLVEKALQASSMKGNPIALSREELTEILMGVL